MTSARSVLAGLCLASLTPACSHSHDCRTIGAQSAEIETLIREGGYERAEAEVRTMLTEHPESADSDTCSTSISELLVRSLIANGRGASPEALAIAERSLNARESGGGEPGSLVPLLLNRADVLRERGDSDPALRDLRRALAILERAPDPNQADLAGTLDRISQTARVAGRYDDAVAAAERGLAIREQLADERDLARSLELLARAFQARGDYEQAGPLVSRALELRRRTAENHPDFVETLWLLSYQEWWRGRLDAAHAAATTAVALAGRTLRADHPGRARSLRLLAGAKLDLWDIQQASELWSQALGVAERALGQDHPDLAGYSNDLAAATFLLGDYEEARRQYERSLAIREQQNGEADSIATIVYNLGLVDARLADFDRAEAEYRRAVTLWEGLHGSDHVFVAQALAALGHATLERGRPAEALPYLQRALAIRERRLGRSHRTVARTLHFLAAAYAELDRLPEARQTAERALQIWADAGSPEDGDYAQALALAADLADRAGDLSRAKREYGLALALSRRILGSAHPDVAQVQLDASRTLARSGRVQDGFDGAKVAEAAGREHLRLMLRSLPERQALNYASRRPRGTDLMLSMTGVLAGSAFASAEAVIRNRALVLDEMAARRRAIVLDRDPETAALSIALASALQRAANLAVQGPASMPRAKYEALLHAARTESELAERRLAAASAVFRTERNRAQVGLDAVVAALPPGAVLVSFVRYQRLPLRPTGGSTRLAPGIDSLSETPAYLAFVIAAGRDPKVVPLGGAAEVEARVSRWRADVAADVLARAPTRGSAPSSRVSGQALRKMVWDPLNAHVSEAATVFVVADGALGLVPFAALPGDEGRYLLEQLPPIHYLTAERDLVIPATSTADRSRGLLALGGATFDPADPSAYAETAWRTAGSQRSLPIDPRAASLACGGLQSHRFEPLGGTLDEVRDVSRIWSAAPAGSTAQVLTGREATERAIKEEARKHLVLHFATHGFFLDESCSAPPDGTAVVGLRGVGGLSSTSPVQNPLRLSGLALAGANARAQAKPDEEDGILTAEEVSSLDLHGVEWAVLSACDTGVGEIKAGEGVFGLRRAFQVAGARTVIMSLWSVDDQATRAWMRALYEGRFQRQLSTADAVHQASLTVLRDRRARGQSTHPFFWAAFVAAGDWR